MGMKGKYNIVIILADALRADHLSCYGYYRPTSPNIDHFSRRSHVFRSAFSVSPSTISAIPSILTGLYPSMHGTGVDQNILNFNRNLPVLPEILQKAGYATVAFNTNPLVVGKYGYDRGFDQRYDIFPSDENKSVSAELEHDIDGVKQTISLRFNQPYICSGEMNKKVEQWLIQNNHHPFFMWLHYMDTHSPYLPREPYFSKYTADRDQKNVVEFLMTFNDVFSRIHQGIKPDPDELKQLLIDSYDSEISYFDAHFAGLLDSLKNQSVLDRTIIFLVADHGEEFWEHGYWGHQVRMYESNLHVPLIMYAPGLTQGGGVISKQVRNIDIFASVCELLDIHKIDHCGVSLLPYIRDEEHAEVRPVISEGGGIKSLSQNKWIDRLYSIRTPRYKYIKNTTKNEKALYDLYRDPMEIKNRADELQWRKVTEELDNELCCTLKINNPNQTGGDVPEFSEQVAERLKSLGYL